MKIGISGFEYKDEESPVERLKNKLSTLFLVIESGKCDSKMKNEALKVMPEIIEHLSNIEDFYSVGEDRSFRVKGRYISSNRVWKQRDYVTLNKFIKFGVSVYEFCNTYKGSIGEIYEMRNDIWVKLTEQEIKKLYGVK